MQDTDRGALAGLIVGAAVLVAVEIGDRDEPAVLANVRHVPVRLREELLAHHIRRAVCDHAIALHLPETQPAIPRTPFHGLSVEHLRRAARSRVDLVVHHVLEPLVVSRPEEYQRR